MKNNIKQAREKTGKTQKHCADELGITLRAWQGYEQGIREPKYEILCKIANIFNVTTDYLLGRDNGEPESINCLPDKANMTALEKKILDNYMTLPESTRKELMEFLHKSVKEVQSESDN